MAALPYVTATGNIERALLGIKSAATPERVSQDFVKTILKIRGGSGNQMTSYLRKIGFVNADGTPSEIYKRFRNDATSGAAAADAIRAGYPALFTRNEYMHRLPDPELRGLIIEETGQSKDSAVASMVLACIKALKKFAQWDSPTQVAPITPSVAQASAKTEERESETSQENEAVGLNLSYTINLNLPATTDIAVFNAIFKSLKENLLKR